jgi:hypothetical protein
MPPRSTATTAKPYVLGKSRFAAIAAVEGLKLSHVGEARLQRTRTLTPKQRRTETIRAFSESRKHT